MLVEPDGIFIPFAPAVVNVVVVGVNEFVTLRDILPPPSTGVPLELLEICHVPLAVNVPTPVAPDRSIVNPLLVMFVQDPCAAEKLTPPVPPVLVISIQNPDPTFGVFGENQLAALTPFNVAAPLPAKFSGVVPLQLGDCTLDPLVNVIDPDPSWLTPPASLAMVYVPEALVVPDPPVMPMVSPPAVILVYAPVAAVNVVPLVPPVWFIKTKKPAPTLAVAGANQFELPILFNVAVPSPARTKLAEPL
jgi:hypothetical protein